MNNILYHIFCSLEDSLKVLENIINDSSVNDKTKEKEIEIYQDFLVYVHDEIYPNFIKDIDDREDILACINNIILNTFDYVDFEDIRESFRIIKKLLKEGNKNNEIC